MCFGGKPCDGLGNSFLTCATKRYFVMAEVSATQYLFKLLQFSYLNEYPNQVRNFISIKSVLDNDPPVIN